MDSREGSSSRQKKETRAVEKFSSNFYTVVVQRQQHNPTPDSEPDPSGILLLSDVPPLLPVFSEFLPPTFSALRVSFLFGSDAQVVLSFPALEAGPSLMGIKGNLISRQG